MGVINPNKDEELLEEPIEEYPVLHLVEVDDCWTTGELKKKHLQLNLILNNVIKNKKGSVQKPQ